MKEFRPLAGIRIIDFGEVMAGPYCCSLLADLGAEVIKVESVNRLPALTRGGLSVPSERRRYGYPDQMPGDRPHERYVLFHTVERNKLGITIDVSHAEGQRIFELLLQLSDGIVSNYGAGALDRLGFPMDRLAALNPKLVVTLMPGFGLDGPYRDRLVFGVVTDFVSGHASLRGYPDTFPGDIPYSSFPDSIAGLHAAFGTIAALIEVRRRGAGQLVEVSHLEATLQLMAEALARESIAPEALPLGAKSRNGAPSGCFPCAPNLDLVDADPQWDDQWIAISVQCDRHWEALCDVMERPDLVATPEFATIIGRMRNQDKLVDILTDFTSTRMRDLVVEKLSVAGCPAVACASPFELARDGELVRRGILQKLHHKYAGDQLYLGAPFRPETGPVSVKRPPNTVGEHNLIVLRDILKLSEEKIARLEADGVIGSTFARTLISG